MVLDPTQMSATYEKLIVKCERAIVRHGTRMAEEEAKLPVLRQELAKWQTHLAATRTPDAAGEGETK
jgi:hypothetical protein